MLINKILVGQVVIKMTANFDIKIFNYKLHTIKIGNESHFFEMVRTHHSDDIRFLILYTNIPITAADS